MISNLRVTVLADNSVSALDALAEHGLSLLVEADSHRILFDTGQGRVLRNNTETLGLSLAPLDAVVLSHGHCDHTAGLASVLEEAAPAAVFLHPAALQPRYVRSDPPVRDSIGMPEQSRLKLNHIRDRIVWTQAPTEIVPGIWCTGEIPRLAPGCERGGVFFLDTAHTRPDAIPDDQALFIETSDGLVVITGCAHAGIVNTLNRVGALTGSAPVRALIGGFHLGGAPPEQIEECISAIGACNLQFLAPCHCTGMTAHARLRSQFGALVRDIGAGSRLSFG